MRGRAVIRRLLLALILLAPGTPAIVAQDVAAHAATQPQTVSVAALSAASAPPDDRLHLAALPTPSGAS
ncbi:MAG TPA: hypothetical protein VFU72_04360, partial [Nitrolancea sp.]|nr:hypothetical protein [Nitrolancea sp.]